MIKTEHAGAKNGGGYWGRRAVAKARCRSLRRVRDRAAVAEQLDALTDDTGMPDPDWDTECDPNLPAYRLEGETTIGTLERLP